MRRWAPAAVVAVLVLAVALVAVAVPADATRVIEAFWRGSLGTRSGLFSGTLVRAVPLILVGVGIAIAFRAGVLNIGGEGQFLLGAVAATSIALHLPPALHFAGVLLALAGAVIAGGAWAGIAAFLRARYGVLEVISTIMLNFVAANLVSYLVRGPMQEPTRVYPQTAGIEAFAQLERLWPGTRLHSGILIAVVVAAAAWWVLTRTAAGFRARAVGASPTAAQVTGRVSVPRVSATALIASGALAGLAGGIEVLGVTYALYENISPGYGFAGIAVAVLAGLNPLAVIGTGLLFAVFETGALGMQRDAGVPSVLAAALEAAAILVFVGLGAGIVRSTWRQTRAAASPGEP